MGEAAKTQVQARMQAGIARVGRDIVTIEPPKSIILIIVGRYSCLTGRVPEYTRNSYITKRSLIKYEMSLKLKEEPFMMGG